MSSHTIYIKSSSGDYYDVVLNLVTFEMACDCQAGMFGDFCKHLKTFFESDCSLLHQHDQLSDFEAICRALKTSHAYAAYEELQTGLKDLERQKKALTKQGGELKAAFMRKLRGKE